MSRIAIGLIVLIPLAGCGSVTVGSGRVVTEERSVGDVRKVKLAGVGDLTVEFGETPFLEVETDDNILSSVETKESGNELTIRVKGNVMPTNGIKVRLTVKSLEDISLSGSGTATVLHWTDSEGKISLSGSGDLVLTDA